MPLMQWKDQFSIGIAAVDHEHKQLIDLINHLYEEYSKGGSKRSVEAFFGDLLKDISAHFALEERFMRERRYDQLPQHKADHERLLDEIRDLMDDFEDAAEMQSDELAARLDTWFARHFETHDARLHKALGSHSH
jgi:hemerythrin-like metal-binding protein